MTIKKKFINIYSIHIKEFNSKYESGNTFQPFTLKNNWSKRVLIAVNNKLKPADINTLNTLISSEQSFFFLLFFNEKYSHPGNTPSSISKIIKDRVRGADRFLRSIPLALF